MANENNVRDRIAGENYEIQVEGRVARCRVWRRPDLSSEDGARCAEEMAAHLRRVARDPGLSAAVWDVSEAPPVVGERTQSAMAEILRAFSTGAAPLALVVGPSATQRLQLERLAAEHGRGRVHVVDRRGLEEKLRELGRER